MKTIKLSTEEAQALYKSNPEFRTTLLSEFTDVELGIIPELKDFEQLVIRKGNCFIDTYGKINRYVNTLGNKVTERTYSSEMHAKRSIAERELGLLMADLKKECQVDWEDVTSPKYIINRYKNKVNLDSHYSVHCFLAFRTRRVRDAFFKKHERLIRDYLMIPNCE